MANLYSIRKIVKVPSSLIITKPKKAKGQPKWQLNITLDELKQKNQLVGLASSYVIRSLDDIIGTGYSEERVRELKQEIGMITGSNYSKKNQQKLMALQKELFNLLYFPYITSIHVDKAKHYDRLLEGFTINVFDNDTGELISSTNYKYFLSTSASIKKWEIFFVDERYVDELQRRVDNGRDMSKQFVPAKLAAYRALTMSSSNPVSNTSRVLVVNDLEVSFKTEVLELDGSKQEEPIMRHVKDYDMGLNCTDGFGFISREFAEVWAEDLHLDYTPAGFITRNAFCKGVLVPFDYKAYADEVGIYYIEDIWGNVNDIREIDIVLTTSMLKLANSYTSYAQYFEECEKNKYTFSVTKYTPKVIDVERTTNYQFIQSLELSDEDLYQFIKPTLDEIKNVKGMDYRHTLAYLRGVSLTEDTNVVRNDFSTALMINGDLVHDGGIRSQINSMIKKRISDAKKGTIKVRGNYQTVNIDPIMLCQHMFGQPIKGLLKENEIFNRFWVDKGAKEVVALRAPMVSYNNVKIVNVVTNDEIEKWYGHLNGLVIINGCDTLCARLSGMDMDGDSMFTTDDPYMLKGYRRSSLPVICLQNSVPKVVCSMEHFQNSDRQMINSKVENVGVITNRATSIECVKAKFPVGSKEWLELDYRVQACIMKSQDSIDAAKGIDIPFGFPKSWINYRECKINDNDSVEEKERKEFYGKIVADKKPLFMTEVYPTLKKERDALRKKENMRCLTRYGRTLDEVLENPLTDEERETVKFYHIFNPVDESPCVMNKIYRMVEEEFKNFKVENIKKEHYVELLKTDKGYPKRLLKELDDLYLDYTYMNDMLRYKQNVLKESSSERTTAQDNIIYDLQQKAYRIHNNKEELCNAIVDYVYLNPKKSKNFLWCICGEQLILNLLSKHDFKVSYPILVEDDEPCEFEYKGLRFKMYTKIVEGVEDYETIG